ncbi:MAG: CRISPR-associated endonuclease Cas1 [Nitrosarchaeum sp.]
MKSLLLSGYGLSIKVKDTRLVFSQGTSVFSEKQEPLEIPVSKCNFDKVIIQGKGYVSTEALERLAESNINVIMLDKRGKLYIKYHTLKNTTLKSSIIHGKIDDIGKIKPSVKKINLNGDKKRLWLGRINSVDDKITNDSMPLSLNHMTKEQIHLSKF